MKRLLKWLKYIAIIATSVIVLGIVYIKFFLDPNDYKADIIALAKEQTGRDLAINGEITFNLFPGLELEVNNAEFANAEGFSDEPQAQVGKFELGVALFPFLRDELRISYIKVHEAKIRLETDAQGRTNLDDIAEHKAKKVKAESGATEDDGSEPATGESDTADATSNTEDNAPKKQLNIAWYAMELIDAEVYVSNAKTKSETTINGVNILLGENTGDGKFPLTAEFKVTQTVIVPPPKTADNAKRSTDAQAKPITKKMAVTAKLSSNVDMDLFTQQYALNDFKAEATLGLDLFKEPAEIEMSAVIKADLNTQVINVQQLVVKAEAADNDKHNLKATLSSDITANLGDQRYQANGLKFDAKVFAKELSNATDVKFSGNIDANLGADTIAISNLVAQVANLIVDGSVTASKLDNPIIAGSLATNEFDLRQFAKRAHIEIQTSDENTLKKAQVKAAFKHGNGVTQLSQLRLMLDDTIATGSASFGKKIAAQLNVNEINLDRYLPPPAKADDSKPEASTDENTGPTTIDLSFVKTLLLDADLKIGKLVANKLTMGDVSVQAKGDGKTLRTTTSVGSFYDGALALRANLSADNNLSISGSLGSGLRKSTAGNKGRVNLGSVLLAMAQEAFLRGNAHSEFKFTSKGQTTDELLANLNGNFALDLKDGIVMDTNVMQYYRQAQYRYDQLVNGATAEPPQPQTIETDKIAAKVSAKIVNGVLTSDDLSLMAPGLRGIGKGKINLRNMTLDYTATLRPSNTGTGQKGKSIDETRGIPIPVRCQGSLLQPDCSTDFTSLVEAERDRLKEKAKARLKEEEEKARARLKEEEKKAKARLEKEKKKAEDKVKERLEKEKEKFFKKLF